VTNLGSGREISIGRLAEKISEVLGARAEIALDDERLRPAGSEVERLCSDASFAASLGWRPEVSLEDGLRATADWIAQNGRFFRAGRYAV
jgi:nucleoside-diphosphate-sugar epimerase